jgi:hypothetical protein
MSTGGAAATRAAAAAAATRATDFFNTTLFPVTLYQLQVLPDTLLMGSIVFAILLANPPVLALALGLTATQGIVHAAGTAIAVAQPGQTIVRSSLDTCTGGYVGRTWGRLFRAGTEALWHPYAPSVYLATIGFIVAYGAAISQLYMEEVQAGMMPRNTLIGLGVLTAIFVLVTLIFRIGSGCESLLGALGGLALGSLLGYLVAIVLGYATDRRGTNLWGIPLLRDRINAGSAVYVCPK